MSRFACNILELRCLGGTHVVAMSATAHAALTVSLLAPAYCTAALAHLFTSALQSMEGIHLCLPFLLFIHPLPPPPPFQPSQLSSLALDPLVVDIPTIERLGGGSVRCMLCELF
jgi:hypothetical protein